MLHKGLERRRSRSGIRGGCPFLDSPAYSRMQRLAELRKAGETADGVLESKKGAVPKNTLIFSVFLFIIMVCLRYI